MKKFELEPYHHHGSILTVNRDRMEPVVAILSKAQMQELGQQLLDLASVVEDEKTVDNAPEPDL